MNKGRGRKSLLIVLVLALLLTGCVSVAPTSSGYGSSTSTTDWDDYEYEWDASQEVVKEEPKEGYTVMIYMVGSNLESEGSAASYDIDEMLMSGIDLSKHNVVIYTGGSYRWGHGIPSDRNCIIELSEDGGLELVKDYGQILNMGESDTFRDFIDYCYENYNTEHYALICWDHGNGPVIGFGSDEYYRSYDFQLPDDLVLYDGLCLPEMKSALEDSVLGRGEKLDWIGFDACLMASIEVADIWKDYADYMVASQDTESVVGWNYSFLSVLNETSDTQQIAERIIDEYKKGVEVAYWGMSEPPTTLSCMKLSDVESVVVAMDELFDKMDVGIDDGNYARFVFDRSNTKSFAGGESSGQERGFSLDIVDLWDMSEKLSAEYPQETQKLQELIDDMVMYQVSNISGAHGVSLYYPYEGDKIFTYMGEGLYGDISVTDSYKSYMKKYTDEWLQSTPNKAMHINKSSIMQTDEITVQLTEEQGANVSEVSYTILEEVSDERYRPVLFNCRVDVDENNVVHLPKDMEVFYLETDCNDGFAVLAEQTEKSTDLSRYALHGMSLSDAEECEVPKSVVINVTEDKNNQVQINSVLDGSSFAGKSDIDYSRYNAITSVMLDYAPLYNNEGAILPCKEWRDMTETSVWNKGYYNQTFSISKKSISEMDSKMVCQIVFRDAGGELYGTELIELQGGKKAEKKEVKIDTQKGEMTYVLYDDYAKLVRYEGEDTTLTIPEEVEGKKVEQIGTYAFRHEESLAQTAKELISVDLPDGLKVISTFAFSGCEKLEKITIPKGVECISGGAFTGCGKLEEIGVESGGKYVTKDGVLFTADMKTLVAYTGKGEEEYTIPDGVEKIENYAFYGMEKLIKVQFSNSVRTIGIQAFYDCWNYNEIIIGEGVETIMAGAFGAAMRYVEDEFRYEPKRVKKVYLGSGLSEMADSVFVENVEVEKFEVSDKNNYYASKNDSLTNKAGDILFRCNVQDNSKMKIPEGIVVIAENSLDGAGSKVTELTLPDSLSEIDKSAGLPYGAEINKLSIGSGLERWECVDEFRGVSEIVISEKNPYFTVVDKVVYNKDQTVLYMYPGEKVKADKKFTVPEGVKEIHKDAFGESYALVDAVALEEITLPSTFEKICGDETDKYENVMSFEGLDKLKAISVSTKNAKYMSEDGLLYDKAGKSLLYCPKARVDSIHVKEGVEEIGEGIFMNVSAKEIYLPDSLKMIRARNFVYLNYELEKDGKQCHIYLPDSIEVIEIGVLEKLSGISSDAQYEPVEGFVVHVKAGSNAEKIAKERGFKIEYIK